MSIEVKQLTKKFNGFTAVEDVTFSVEDGEFVTLLGPSGSGKSTILRCVAGLELPSDGNIIVDQEDVTHIPVQERKVGFVFQHYALFKHINVLQNISFGLKVRGVDARTRTEKAKELIELIGLNGMEKRLPSQLSGGQRQRVALARALAPAPKLLLLDEPFGALDTRLRKTLRVWLRNLHDQIGLTTLLVTHDQDEAFELSNRVLVVNKGRVEQDASPKKIFNEPSTEFVATFVGESNHVDGVTFQNQVKWGPLHFPLTSHQQDGVQAAVYFRPIDVYVSSEVEEDCIKGTIQSIQFLGAFELLNIYLGESYSIIAQIPQGVSVQSNFFVGKRVFISITAYHVFVDNKNINLSSTNQS